MWLTLNLYFYFWCLPHCHCYLHWKKAGQWPVSGGTPWPLRPQPVSHHPDFEFRRCQAPAPQPSSGAWLPTERGPLSSSAPCGAGLVGWPPWERPPLQLSVEALSQAVWGCPEPEAWFSPWPPQWQVPIPALPSSSWFQMWVEEE